jgi:queuine tRNA-ribosyltransferase subunit QTRTD1
MIVEGRKDLETPNFLAVSSRGVIPHMTPDVIAASTQIGGIHMAIEDCKSGSRSRAQLPLLI